MTAKHKSEKKKDQPQDLRHLRDCYDISQRADDGGRRKRGVKSRSEAKYYTDEETEFLRACDLYRESTGLRFLKASDYLYVLTQILGYRRA